MSDVVIHGKGLGKKPSPGAPTMRSLTGFPCGKGKFPKDLL